MKVSTFVPKSNLGTFTNADEHMIEQTIKLPTPVLKQSLEEYNNKKDLMGGVNFIN